MASRQATVDPRAHWASPLVELVGGVAGAHARLGAAATSAIAPRRLGEHGSIRPGRADHKVVIARPGSCSRTGVAPGSTRRGALQKLGNFAKSKLADTPVQ
jgi:hypothetical protein